MGILRSRTAYERSIRFSLISCLILTAVALGRVAIWKREVPSPNLSLSIPSSKLLETGWRRSASIPSRQGQVVTTGEGMLYERSSLDRLGAKEELKLTPVRVRGFRDLDTQTIRDQLLGGSGTPSHTHVVTIRGESLLLSRQDDEQSLEACIANNHASSRGDVLTEALTTRPLTLKDRLLVVAGLRQPRIWECLFVQLSTDAGSDRQAALQQAWKELREPLKVIH